MTRILQESLGGNSRTTLIVKYVFIKFELQNYKINFIIFSCSPSDYNTDETISTLRFGMRAKSIKNTARVNTELSPAELKTLLKKSQRDKVLCEQYISALESELKLWRSGKTVPKEEWASKDTAASKENLPIGSAATNLSTPSIPSTPARSASSLSNPTLDTLRDDNRSMTPVPLSLDKDEREDFLKRENDLSDQLADKVTEIVILKIMTKLTD